ncbi:MAG: hypothetical protein ACE5G8_17745, partial [Anaerolineae bacterium]
MTYLIRRRPVHRTFDWQQVFDRMFDDSFLRLAGLRGDLDYADVAPLALDMYETDDTLVIEAALPGIAPDEVDISIQ